MAAKKDNFAEQLLKEDDSYLAAFVVDIYEGQEKAANDLSDFMKGMDKWKNSFSRNVDKRFDRIEQTQKDQHDDRVSKNAIELKKIEKSSKLETTKLLNKTKVQVAVIGGSFVLASGLISWYISTL